MEAVEDLAQTILVDDLRPALTETLEAVARLGPALAGVDPDDLQSVLDGARAAQDTRRKLVILADRRSAIYQAADMLRHWLGLPRYDDGAFLRYRNAAALWGGRWAIRTQAQARGDYPWPTARLANLLWSASPAAQSWLPTPEEQDEALAEFLRATKPLVIGGTSTGPRRAWYADGKVQPADVNLARAMTTVGVGRVRPGGAE